MYLEHLRVRVVQRLGGGWCNKMSYRRTGTCDVTMSTPTVGRAADFALTSKLEI